MTEDEAQQAGQTIHSQLPHVDAVPVDPRQYLVLAWDRWSVEMILDALAGMSAAGRPVPAKLLQELADWLALWDPHQGDDEA